MSARGDSLAEVDWFQCSGIEIKSTPLPSENRGQKPSEYSLAHTKMIIFQG